MTGSGCLTKGGGLLLFEVLDDEVVADAQFDVLVRELAREPALGT